MSHWTVLLSKFMCPSWATTDPVLIHSACRTLGSRMTTVRGQSGDSSIPPIWNTSDADRNCLCLVLHGQGIDFLGVKVSSKAIFLSLSYSWWKIFLLTPFTTCGSPWWDVCMKSSAKILDACWLISFCFQHLNMDNCQSFNKPRKCPALHPLSVTKDSVDHQ